MKAGNGKSGASRDRFSIAGENAVLKVPVCTQMIDGEKVRK
nr:hypothetical protein [Wolbachia endosymbiont of Litomosoides sigmodontis]